MSLKQRIEKLKNSYLETNNTIKDISCVLSSTEHREKDYIAKLENVFGIIQDALEDLNKRVKKLEERELKLTKNFEDLFYSEINTLKTDIQKLALLLKKPVKEVIENEVNIINNKQYKIPYIVERHTCSHTLDYITLGNTRSPQEFNHLVSKYGKAIILLSVNNYVNDLDIKGLIGNDVNIKIITNDQVLTYDSLPSNNNIVYNLDTNVKKIIITSEFDFLVDSITLYSNIR